MRRKHASDTEHADDDFGEVNADPADEELGESAYPGIDIDASEPHEHVGETDSSEWDWEEHEEKPGWTLHVARLALVLLGAAWTAFFIWAKLPAIRLGVTPDQLVSWTQQWCVPLLLMAVAYLLFLRTSTREAGKFTDVAASLRAESMTLENRLHRINNELSLAREFIANQSLELESVGRTSTAKLVSHAEKIQQLIGDSDEKVQTIGQVSKTALANIDKLREQLPVITNSAKDVTSQLANAGRNAQAQVQELIDGFLRVNEFGQASDKQILLVKERTEAFVAEMSQSLDSISQSLSGRFARISAESETVFAELEENGHNLTEFVAGKLTHIAGESENIFQQMDEHSNNLTHRISSSLTSLRDEQAENASAMDSQLENYESALIRLAEIRHLEGDKLADMGGHIQQLLDQCQERIVQIDREGGDRTAKMAFAISALDDNLDRMLGKVGTSHADTQSLITHAERLMLALESSARDIDETLPRALDRLDARVEQSLSGFETSRTHITGMKALSDDLCAQFDTIETALENRMAQLSALSAHDTGWQAQAEAIDKLIASIRSVRIESDALAENAGTKLVNALADVRTGAQEAARLARVAVESSIGDAASELGSKTEAALEKILHSKTSQLVGQLESSVSQAVGATDEAAAHLQDQLVKVAELTSNLERRVTEAREKAEASTDEDFARRVALLTESLNSTAIDVTKIFSNEVTDTAWAAYLRGDRGVFTRRAVRLLDSGEVREISRHYENDREFREHVNRYIHDFEAMLRDLLSTRDGGVIGVTLLSSDMGKLYVALAQAIERLRQ